MKVMQEGFINCISKFKALEKGWDGYDGKPIKKKVMDMFTDMAQMSKYFRLFNAVGFSDSDIDAVPTSKGTIQLEAQKTNEKETIYFEIEINGDS